MGVVITKTIWMKEKLIKRILKKVFHGVSWQHPFLNVIFKVVDPIDWLVRKANRREHQPAYSIRVRSNGTHQQFGGRRFDLHGKLIRSLLINHAGLLPDSTILEIGCGCGRNAIALSEYIDNGRYIGVDIERISFEACTSMTLLKRKNFSFELMSIFNSEYNPKGEFSASKYKFPYKDDIFDVIFLISVFTHMRPAEVENYLAEITRILKPGGACLMSFFLMDEGNEGSQISFPYKEDNFYYVDKKMPEIAVGYDLNYICHLAEKKGLGVNPKVLWGTWRGVAPITSDKFSQDIIIFRKNINVYVD